MTERDEFVSALIAETRLEYEYATTRGFIGQVIVNDVPKEPEKPATAHPWELVSSHTTPAMVGGHRVDGITILWHWRRKK
jgi:hypothetical protein